MMLLDSKKFPKNIDPYGYFNHKITPLTNCDLTESEINLFNLALKTLSTYLSDNNINISNHFTLNVVFTLDGTMSFTEDNHKNCGSQFHMAIYRMEKLRSFNSDAVTLFIYLEELVHYFLNIYDETIVKHKVTEIMKYVTPDFSLDYFKMKGLDLNGL